MPTSQSNAASAPGADTAADASKRKYVAIAAAVIIAATAAVYFLRGNSNPAGPPNKAFYTSDDGATTFVDAADRIPPFDHAGQPAVRAIVYTTDHGAHHWVQYLFRYKENERARLEQTKGATPGFGSGEVKSPGQSQWVGEMDPRAGAIMLSHPPPGIPAGDAAQMFP